MGRGRRARERGAMRVRWSGGAAALLALGCVDRPEIEMPVPPDLAPLVEAYAQPDGTVAPQDVACLARSALDRVEDQRLRQVGEVLLDALQALQQRLQASGMPTETAPRSTRTSRACGACCTCSGSVAAGIRPRPPRIPGRTGRSICPPWWTGTLRPVIWGQATACRARVDAGRRRGEPLPRCLLAALPLPGAGRRRGVGLPYPGARPGGYRARALAGGLGLPGEHARRSICA